ncbi:sulfonate transport system substrate-binding protein [Andreprevotia lacus DSM 23236]|jgi:sulfonate transport system substrate-binding protein|uniref:Sulfonate transport system substrate-binding protein n=1 Tax=Andreprevotia lacus DSM 23236 TaxID=1121001 RepID=A0A1W1X5C5_9NEIS|nr:aliphatic sulfonate ABC transporter substrate-binding protein [Andreprevotia lacus]SMC19040.1 sulfonate transport system substrate-binding protein [Andreprevotia lacus DSM 23236]
MRSLFHRLRPWAAGTGIVLALLLALPALATPQPAVIRIGVSTAGVGNPPRVSTGWTSVAQVHHYVEDEFAKDGVKVEWIFFKGQGPAVNEAISNNQLDFTTLGDLPAIVGRSVGLDTRLVLVTGSRGNVFVAVRPDSGIKTIADLRGKRVAFNKGTATQLAAARILATVGLNERDIRVVNMEPATAKAAFLSGDVDALFTTLEGVKLQQEGKARIIYSSRDFPDASSQGFVLVNQRFAQQYPAATQRVVTALVRAADWASSDGNRDAVLKLWGSAGSIPEALYREEYNNIPFAQRLSPLFDPFIVARSRQSAADAYKYKLIRQPVDVDRWIDRRYLDAALKALKLEKRWPQFDAAGKSQING